MDFQVFHRYNRLARRGLTKPLVCKHCDNTYVLQADANTEPVLVCYTCGTLTRPGQAMYSNIKAVVQEHADQSNKQPFKGPV